MPVRGIKGSDKVIKKSSFLCISSRSQLTVYRISGLPSFVEQVFRRDLDLPMLWAILEHDLQEVPFGCQLKCIGVEFRLSTDKNVN